MTRIIINSPYRSVELTLNFLYQRVTDYETLGAVGFSGDSQTVKIEGALGTADLRCGATVELFSNGILVKSTGQSHKIDFIT